MYIMATLVCEICREKIGKFRPDLLAVPVMSSMFESLDPERGYPRPFRSVYAGIDLDWDGLRCPICRKRPFLNEDRVLTTEGIYVIGSNDYPGLAPYVVRPEYTDEELEDEWFRRMAGEVASPSWMPAPKGETDGETDEDDGFEVKDFIFVKRNVEHANTSESVAAVRRLYEKGLTATEIAEHTHLERTVVQGAINHLRRKAKREEKAYA